MSLRPMLHKLTMRTCANAGDFDRFQTKSPAFGRPTRVGEVNLRVCGSSLLDKPPSLRGLPAASPVVSLVSYGTSPYLPRRASPVVSLMATMRSSLDTCLARAGATPSTSAPGRVVNTSRLGCRQQPLLIPHHTKPQPFMSTVLPMSTQSVSSYAFRACARAQAPLHSTLMTSALRSPPKKVSYLRMRAGSAQVLKGVSLLCSPHNHFRTPRL